MRGRREHVHQGGGGDARGPHPGRQPREARPPGRPTPTRVARGRSALSPPPAAGPAKPSAAQSGATRACLGPNLRSVSARTHRRPCCRLASSAPLLRPYRPLLVARQRHSRAHPFALLARARAPRSLGGGDDDMADTDQPRRSSTSWSRETQTNGKISSPAGDLRTKYQHTHSKEAPIDVACALPAKQYGAVAHRVRAHHAPCKPLTAQPCNTGTRRGRAAEGSTGIADPACYALDAPATRVA